MEEENRASQSTSPENTEVMQEAEEESTSLLSEDMYYKYEDLYFRPVITADSNIPENLLHLSHSFGYDSGRRMNLKLLDDRTLIFIAGNLLVLLDVSSREQKYLRSCSGGGIGSITTHPSKDYFVAAEKGTQPNIIVYEYPSLRPYRILRGGTEQAYSFVDFNADGSLLASVGSTPDYLLTLWNWKQEEVILSCKAVSQEVYRVSFSPYNPELLTSSGSGHIKFWKMTSTFTGLKLQGLMGHFGKTAGTDIEAYLDLPDGKVVSGSEWGNLLLWDGNYIKVEIGRKEGNSCHVGTVQPFALEHGQLMTFGSDGVVRGWDFKSIDTADSNSNSSRFELEPMNEMVVGHNVCLTSMVKSSLPDSFIWFAQDSSGAIWKLDLSFSLTASGPECLFSFHAGAIQGLDVSKNSHLMATTTLDRSVKVFDYVSKKELTTSRFSQGGTALSWAPPLVDESGGLLATGFEDGVVRLLELYDPQKLHVSTGHRPKGDATLRLKQALKPHNAPVTALAFERNGGILATGSSDCTVFFFTVGEKYEPIGFIHVPGPVQGLEWSPEWHSDNRLLILCQSGHVVEVQSPDPKAEKPNKTFQLPELPRRSFRFRSIKSRIKREEEIARRQTIKRKEKERECEDEAKNSEQPDAQEEEEKDLPPIYIPNPPSPLYCGFYSLPGQFWLSLGGYDSGFLYHCKFSEEQAEDTNKQEDEPFGFLPVNNADSDPIRTVTFSSNRQLLLCGMHSGSIRVYLLQHEDHSFTSMQPCWTLSVHDNQYGHMQHICCSHDDRFVLTGGNDGNIFSFSLLPTEELQKLQQAKVPSPRAGIENEVSTQDIVDPAAYSIELAKQKLEKDQLCREAELKIAERRGKLAELSKIYNNVLIENRSLPEHVCLKAEELQLHPCFRDYSEQLKSQRVIEVRQQFKWEQVRCDIALRQLQDWFRDSLQNVVTVVAICSNNRVSTYRVSAVTQASAQRSPTQQEANEAAAVERRKSIIGQAKTSTTIEEEELLHPDGPRPTAIKLGDRQIERLRKAAEKAEQARAKIEKRKQEWAQLYAEKPDENYEDPQALQAIQEARENIGDIKLKSAKDFTVPIHLRTNAERKRAELKCLEENMHELQTEMNRRVVALRDSKVGRVSLLKVQAQQLQKVQERLPAHLCREPLPVPFMLPEETPETKMCCSRSILERYRVLRGERFKVTQHEEVEGATGLLEQLEKEMGAHEWKKEEGQEEEGSLSMSSVTREEEEGVKLTALEEELQRENEITLLHEQDSLLEQMERSVWEFDSELMLLRHGKVHLDWQLKQADLCKMVLYQELLLLKEFERREDSLQEKLNECVREENSITSRLEDCNEQLELRHREIAELHEREKVLLASFQALLGKNNKFEDFLTKVFKKKVKRVKKKKQDANEEEEAGSDEDSEEDDDWDDDDYDSETEEGGVPLNDSICPPGCEPELFKKTLELREFRLDLEEQLLEEKKNAELVKKEYDNLLKKEKLVKSSRQAVEEGLELVNKEKQQKMNELHIVVPLRLSQIEFVTNGSLPSDLSQALVVDRMELSRLQERIKQLQVEKSQQRELSFQARQQHTRLIHERKEMIAKIQMLEKQCDKVMVQKFGRQVDLETLQTLSGNQRLEELKQEKLLREAAYAKEIKQCDAMVEEARSALMEVTKANTERLHSMNNVLDQKRELEHKLNARQRKMRQHFQDYRRHMDQEEIRRLHELVKSQSQLAEAYRREIRLLSSKGGHVLPPGRAQLPPLAPVPPSKDRKTSKQGPAHPFK